MNRRNFLNMFAKGLIIVPLAPVAALAVPQRKVAVQQSPLAGFQYYEGERVFNQLRADTPLRLICEVENMYDKNAVAVYDTYSGDNKLGFVPRKDNCAISQLMGRGEPFFTRIVKLGQKKNPWNGIRFEVILDG